MKSLRSLVFCVLAACVTTSLGACMIGDEGEEGAYVHDEPTDFEVDDDGKADGLTASFSVNNVVGDDLFVGGTGMDVQDVQRFFERSPYGTRSWLASHTVNGVSAAQALVNAARSEDIHPMMLLARMQVEAGLVSKTARPSQYRIDRALGCGCPDGSGCSASYRGFDRQLLCGAKTMRRLYDGSVAGTAQWRRGVTRRTLDPRSVTPANHATAALYAYTPWVLVNEGGNWLVWNVTKKYVRHATTNGLLN